MEIKRYLKELQLAERNIDATETALPPHHQAQNFLLVSFSCTPYNAPSGHIRHVCLQEKQRGQREFAVPGSAALPATVSFEDLRRHRDHQLSSKRSVDSFGNMRRAKSDTDIALQSLKKKVEVRVPHPLCTA